MVRASGKARSGVAVGLVLLALGVCNAAQGASAAAAHAEVPAAEKKGASEAPTEKGAAAKPGAGKSGGAETDVAKPAGAKPEATKSETEKPGSASVETGKGEAAKAAKADPAKNEAARAKSGDAAAAGKTGAPPAEGETASDESAGADSKSKPRARSKSASGRKRADAVVENVGEGPSPASPPPLTIAGLRDEVRREAGPVVIDPSSPARTKLEQMLEEVTKARTSLHEDTSKLEAMLTQDGGGAEGASAGGATPGGAAGAGKPAKNPLDILAKALRGIKPEQAAPIVTRLDKRLAATVLQRMPPVDAGKIMGAMKPDTAAELATQIAMHPLASEAKR